MSIFHYIVIFAVSQGYILAFFLVISKFYRNKPNLWLAFFGITLSTLTVFDIIGGYYSPKSIFIEFLLNDLPLEFVVYVPLYLYFESSIEIPNQRKLPKLILFLPFILDTLLNILIVSTYSIGEISNNSNIQTFYSVESILASFYSLYLCYKSYQLVKKGFENSNEKNWLYNVWFSSFVLVVAFSSMSLITGITSMEFSNFFLALYVLIAIWMFWLIFNGVVNLNLINNRASIGSKLKNQIYNESFIPVFEAQKTLPVSVDNKANNLKKETLVNHFSTINSLVQQEYLYRDEDLSIEDICEHLDLSPGYISQIIKQAIDKSFPTWINEFRVSEVKKMLLDKEFENYTTLAIGLEAGFKSKSAFYATFKKMTGVTPAKFRKKKS